MRHTRLLALGNHPKPPLQANPTLSSTARPSGFEPLTFGSGGRRSIQLSYGRIALWGEGRLPSPSEGFWEAPLEAPAPCTPDAPGLPSWVPLEVLPIPCLKDNYAYLVVQGDECVVIDPGESAPVQAMLDDRELELIAILCTHHHADHVAGVDDLIENWDAPVYAHRIDQNRIAGVSHPLEDGDRIELLGERFRVLHNPGHTRGAVSYYTEAIAFTGDTIFCAGVGRLLEGTIQELFESTCRMKDSFSPESTLYTGHEYAENNLRFACEIAPDDLAIHERYSAIRAARSRGECCAKTRLHEELSTNLFLRVHESKLRERLGMPLDALPEQVFRELRLRKDRFV